MAETPKPTTADIARALEVVGQLELELALHAVCTCGKPIARYKGTSGPGKEKCIRLLTGMDPTSICQTLKAGEKVRWPDDPPDSPGA